MGKEIALVDEVKNSLAKMTEQFGVVLPKNMDRERFVRIAQTAIQNNPSILSANRTTLFSACMRAAEDGLLPDGRESALVVFNSKKGPIVQYMPMVAGIKKKVRLSGEIRKWKLQVVFENDEFDWEEGDNDKIYHRPCLNKRGSVIAAYSIVTFKDGEKDREVMSVGDIDKRRKKAKSQNIWNDWYEEMCKKTVAKYHAKSLPMEGPLSKIMASDDNIFEVEHVESKEIEEVKPKEEKKTSSTLAKAVENTQKEDPIEVSERQAIQEETPI